MIRGIASLTSLLFMAACQADHPAAKAVRGYDEAIVQAYRQSNPSLMDAWATEREKNKILALIDLKKESHLVLESELVDLRILHVSADATDSAVVDTEEVWVYFDRPLDPGKPAGTRYKARMRMRWTLAKEGAGFKVDAGRTLSSTYLEPKDYKPEFGRRPDRHSAGGGAL